MGPEGVRAGAGLAGVVYHWGAMERAEPCRRVGGVEAVLRAARSGMLPNLHVDDG